VIRQGLNCDISPGVKSTDGSSDVPIHVPLKVNREPKFGIRLTQEIEVQRDVLLITLVSEARDEQLENVVPPSLGWSLRR